MEQPNRYAPPEAAVADVNTDALPAGPCPHVELACRLMWISFGFSLLNNIARIIVARTTAERVGLIVGSLIGIGLGYVVVSWAVRKLRAGRNWMRWLITSVNVLSWISIAMFWDFYRNLLRVLSENLPTIIGMAVSTAIGLVILVLLHTPTTRRWFNAQSASR